MKRRTVGTLVLGCVLALGIRARAQGFVITTIAGGGQAPSPAPALSSAIGSPAFTAVDPNGNLYFDAGYPSSDAVYKLDQTGTVLRIAGQPGQLGFSGDGRIATSAQLNLPMGLAFDAAGNLYIADMFNNRVRKVTPAGIITTVAGDGTAGFSGDGGLAGSAQINEPQALAFDAGGNLYIADTKNFRIRKVTSAGIISTLAGTGLQGSSGDGGPANNALLSYPRGLACDAAGDVYIADSDVFRIRKVTPTGIISTIAGNGTPGYSGDGGLATNAQINRPVGLGFDAAGNLYIADGGNNRIRKVTQAGIISTLAGNGTPGFSGDGGLAVSAQLSLPGGLAFDAVGNLYIADQNNNRVRNVAPDGVISTVAGNGIGRYSMYSGDGGPATRARLSDSPGGLAFDAARNFYIADTTNHCVRMVTTAGIISTVAGSGISGFSGDGGSATGAQLSYPSYLAFDASGNLYIADSLNSRIRKMTPAGIISTIAGDGTQGFSGDGGPAAIAQLSNPRGLAFDAAGNLYFADSGNDRVRKITPAGIVSTVAGGGTANPGDGGQATNALLSGPEGLTIDAGGNLYFADVAHWRVRRVTPGGIISTAAGNGSLDFSVDGGQATNTGVSPSALAFDSSGNLYISEPQNNRIRRVTPAGIISTVAGSGSGTDSGDGGPAVSAAIAHPNGIAFDSVGNLYVTEDYNLRPVIRLLVPQGTRPVLPMNVTHAANFTQGDTGQTYSIVVKNAQTAGPTTGTLTVTETVPTGLSLISMTGSSWNCSGNSCTRSDALAQSASYPPITVTVNVDDTAPVQFDNEVTLTGGGVVYPLYAFDTTTVNSAAQGCTYSLSPTSQSFPFAGGSGTITITTESGCAWSVTNTLTWVTLTTSASGTGTGTVGFQVAQGADAARTGTLAIAGQTFNLTQDGIGGPCRYLISPTDQSFAAAGGTGTINVTTQSGCAWSVTNSLSWVSLTSSSSGTGTGTANFQVSANTGADRSGTFTIAGATFTVEQVAAGTSQFTSQALFPHFASGGGWNTRLILINTGPSAITARLNFFADAGTLIALPLNLPQTTGTAPLLASTLERAIAAGATLVIDTASADPLSQTGWVQVLSTGTVAGYDNFRLVTSNGFREVFLPLQGASASALLLPFDHTDDYGTGVALANTSTLNSSVGIIIRDDSGNLILTDTVQVPKQGHSSFDLAKTYAATVGKRGTIELDVSGFGGIGALGVRYGSNAEIAAVVPIVK
jgi:sugar lactone lactonase YvrE